MIIVSFFRDFLNGWIYVVYVIICVIMQLALFGIVADRKRKVIENGLLDKKKRDIESGVEAERAALADKQILDVYDENGEKVVEEAPSEEESDPTKQEEVPQVLVIGGDSGDSNN